MLHSPPTKPTASLAPARSANPLASAFRTAYQRAAAQSFEPGHPHAGLRAAAAACRDELAQRWAETQAADRANRAGRRIHYMWATMALHNVAGMGEFSVDRTIREYVHKVWALPARP